MSWDRKQEQRAGRAMTIGSCVFGLGFSIIWCVLAASIGAGFMLIFGIPFAVFMLYRLIFCLKKAKLESASADPWDQPQQPRHDGENPRTGSGFCPYCGEKTESRYAFCPACGRRLP